jgi:hypothetical protein
VKSAPLLAPGRSKPCLIRGRVDVLVDCDDGTKGIVTSRPPSPSPTTLPPTAASSTPMPWLSSILPAVSPRWSARSGCPASCPTPTRPKRGGRGCTGTSSGSKYLGTTWDLQNFFGKSSKFSTTLSRLRRPPDARGAGTESRPVRRREQRLRPRTPCYWCCVQSKCLCANTPVFVHKGLFANST